MAGSYLAFELDELQQKYAEPARRTTSSCGGAACRSESTSCPSVPRTSRPRTWPTRCTSSCKGRGRLRVVDEEIEVEPGKVISVDHGEDHQFIDVTEDLHMLVVFAPPDLPDEE